MEANRREAAAKSALASLKALLDGQQRSHSDKFLLAFLGRASNRRLVHLAVRGHAGARQRVLAKLRLSEVEAQFWSYLKKTLQWETARMMQELAEREAQEAAVLNEPIAGSGSDRASQLADRVDVVEVVAATAASLEETVENPRLWTALASLTPRQRDVLQLLYIADCSEQQAAAFLGISQQAVNKAKMAGLRRLRRAIQDGAKQA